MLNKQTSLIKLETPERVVLLYGLGICEHCQTVLTIEDLPAEAMDAEWRCPKCNGLLTNKTFGYKEVKKEKWEKVLWVGKEGKWVDKEPTESFSLGKWLVEIKHRSTFFF